MKKYAEVRYATASSGVLGRVIFLHFAGVIDFDAVVNQITQTFGGAVKKHTYSSYEIIFKTDEDSFSVICVKVLGLLMGTGWEPYCILQPSPGATIRHLKYTYE